MTISTMALIKSNQITFQINRLLASSDFKNRSVSSKFLFLLKM